MELEKEDFSVEEEFQNQEVPSWKKQLTIRPFVLSVLFCFIVMKQNLTTGIIPSLNVSARLLGGLGSYIFGMSERVAQLSLNTTDFKNPVIGWMIGFLFVVNFLGLFSVVPLRKIMIIDFKLTYPSGTATAHLINSFHTPKRAKLAKKQVHTKTSLALIFLQLTLEGDWHPAGLDEIENYLQSLEGYKIFITISMILGDGLYNFFKVLGHTLTDLYRQIQDKRQKNLILLQIKNLLQALIDL
ncbi:hypothetical protein K1719_043696 [Acacia pycnantha]|nr:hypothetical protein K1719_043696 [Acacia pycnantha]